RLLRINMQPEDRSRTNLPVKDEQDLPRRELLKMAGAGALAATLGAAFKGLHASAGACADPFESAVPERRGTQALSRRAAAFNLADVRLLEGPFRRAQEQDARYLLRLEPDHLLHNFRVNAGLKPKAPVYGGWESQEPWVSIRCHGHTLGHYLGAVAMHHAATGDARFKERADYIVAELRACQQARGDGLVCAFP